MEYGTDCIEVQKTAFKPGDKVILIDDLLATGGTLQAGEKLLQRFEGVEVVSHLLVFEIDALNGRSKLSAPCHTLIHLK